MDASASSSRNFEITEETEATEERTGGLEFLESSYQPPALRCLPRWLATGRRALNRRGLRRIYV